MYCVYKVDVLCIYCVYKVDVLCIYCVCEVDVLCIYCVFTVFNAYIGLDFDGLYRISGNQAQIQKLRFLVDSTEDYNLSDYDVNVLTGALKLFFRELKEPLIPFKLYNILSETIREWLVFLYSYEAP